MEAPTIGSADTGARYYAARGKVYSDRDGREIGTALSANGRELERFEAARLQAYAQRVELEQVAEQANGYTTELLEGPRSHTVDIHSYGRPGLPFDREELFPLVRVSGIPRVGSVLLKLSADRYVHNDSERGNVMGEWRIVPRDWYEDTEDAAARGYGNDAKGIGPKTAPAIVHAAEKLVRIWLASEDYQAARRLAAAREMSRRIRDAAGRSYELTSARQELDAVAPELDRAAASTLNRSLERIAAAVDELEAI